MLALSSLFGSPPLGNREGDPWAASGADRSPKTLGPIRDRRGANQAEPVSLRNVTTCGGNLDRVFR